MKSTWYQRIWETQDLTNTNPKLSPYLDPDKYPQFQANVTNQLMRQSLPLTPLKELVVMTPEKLGLMLGQKRMGVSTSTVWLGELLRATITRCNTRLNIFGRFRRVGRE